MEANQTLDARGLNCPLPVLRTKKTLNAMPSGETLKVMTTDPGALKDMVVFCSQTGNTLLSSGQVEGQFEFFIRKG
jgi:tRNA 2-thiouridine synthesizing protein A